MKTFNRKNTDVQQIKEAKKASKQLRKLRMQNGSMYIEQTDERLGNKYSYEYNDYEEYEEI